MNRSQWLLKLPGKTATGSATKFAQRQFRGITFDNSVACCDGDPSLLILHLLDNMVVQDGQALC